MGMGTTTVKTGMPRELYALMTRYNQLGELLPKPDDLDLDDPAAVAEAEVIIAEMKTVWAEMDAFITAARRMA